MSSNVRNRLKFAKISGKDLLCTEMLKKKCKKKKKKLENQAVSAPYSFWEVLFNLVRRK